MNLVGLQAAYFDQFLDLGDGNASSHGAQRIEVAGGLFEHEVAQAVSSLGLHDGEVAHDGLLEHVGFVPEAACFFAFGDQGSETSWREERRDASATSTQFLG